MEEIKIIKMDNFARGIGYLNNKITFVKNALPNEVVSVCITKSTKKYQEAYVLDYKIKSKKRIKPLCPYYDFCGGCQLLHLNYQDSLLYKKTKVEELLKHNKIIVPDIEVIKNPNPYYYRNKISLKVINQEIGFYEEKTHKLIKIAKCLLASNSLNNLIPKLYNLNIKNGLITIRSNQNEEILLIITTKDKITFNINDFTPSKIVGVIKNDKTIYGDNFLYERINHKLLKISYNSFFQVNYLVASILFNQVENYIDLNSTVLDLYGGVGVLGIMASTKAKSVYSIEIVPNAILDNIQNIKLNKINNIYPILGDVADILNKIPNNFDTVIIDPPRKGIDNKSLQFLLTKKPNKIIYISCNPLTLVRDLQSLKESYHITKLQIYDLFSNTYHVETVVLMSRKKTEWDKYGEYFMNRSVSNIMEEYSENHDEWRKY